MRIAHGTLLRAMRGGGLSRRVRDHLLSVLQSAVRA
jgi:hypothetical protein